jgi:hypothetical protein
MCEDVRSTILVDDGEQTTHFILLSYSLSSFFRSLLVGLQSTPGAFPVFAGNKMVKGCFAAQPDMTGKKPDREQERKEECSG